MRKQTRRQISSFKAPRRRELQLSLETVRMLTSEELLQVVTGCPTGSSSTETQGSSGCI
jgi:hypothetical protein